MSIIYILNQAEKGCGNVVSMKYFIQSWRKESVCFIVWARLATEGIIFLLFFSALCVCYAHFWELAALCVVPETSCMAFRCINCESGEKKIDRDRQGWQKKTCQPFAQRGERTGNTRKAADRHTWMISFWFCWCLIIDRAPLSRVSREKRRKGARKNWMGKLSCHSFQ